MTNERLIVLRRCCALVALAIVLSARPVQAQCSYSVSPMTVSAPLTASVGSLSVVTGTSCVWTAISNDAWITITGGSSGTGLGTVNFNVAANGTARSGTLTVAGKTITINQGTGSGCTASVSPTSASAPLIASTGSLSVVTGTSCSWTAVSNDGWITVTAGASGTGLGTVTYGVAASGAARTGTLTVAGQTVTINQGTTGCSASVSPTTVSAPSIANSNSLSVTAGTSCNWTAVSNVGWVTITAGASGAGLGTVTFSVAANTGAARSGTLTVAGQTVTINQAGDSCSYALSATSATVPAASSTGTLSVTAGTSCAWSAASNVPWIAITGGASGSGIGTVTYSVASNAAAARSGTLTVAGQTFTINQAAGSSTLAPPTNLRIIKN